MAEDPPEETPQEPPPVPVPEQHAELVATTIEEHGSLDEAFDEARRKARGL